MAQLVLDEAQIKDMLDELSFATADLRNTLKLFEEIKKNDDSVLNDEVRKKILKDNEFVEKQMSSLLSSFLLKTSDIEAITINMMQTIKEVKEIAQSSTDSIKKISSEKIKEIDEEIDKHIKSLKAKFSKKLEDEYKIIEEYENKIDDIKQKAFTKSLYILFSTVVITIIITAFLTNSYLQKNLALSILDKVNIVKQNNNVYVVVNKKDATFAQNKDNYLLQLKNEN